MSALLALGKDLLAGAEASLGGQRQGRRASNVLYTEHVMYDVLDAFTRCDSFILRW